MTSMGTSGVEYHYNLVNKMQIRAQANMKKIYLELGEGIQFDEAVELNNALVSHRAMWERMLKSDPSRFVK